MSKSVAKTLSGLFVLMVAVCALLVGTVSYMFFRSNAVASNAQRAKDIAQSVAAQIEPEPFIHTMQTMEKDEHWYRVKKSLDQIKIQTGVQYLYVLGDSTGDSMIYFAEGYDAATDPEVEYDLGEEEPNDLYDEIMFTAMETGTAQVSEIYESGEYGLMVSGFAPIMHGGTAIGVIGIDISIADVMEEANQFGLWIAVIILASCLVFGVLSTKLIARFLGKPIAQLTEAADQLAEGKVEISLAIERKDEVGALAQSFQKMVDNTRNQVDLMEKLAGGDLRVMPQIRSSQDAMNLAIERTAERLNEMFSEILRGSSQVALTAKQISMTAQNLATGTNEQAATVEELSATIEGVYVQSGDNERQAEEAQSATQKASDLMEQSMRSMEEMAQAMDEINKSSLEISKVIKTIDDIAFHTNILALNAAVEAAQAGQHGKGFAVVAEEVRNLASKSSAAAQETAVLIESSVKKVAGGNELTGVTKESLANVNEIAALTLSAMKQINEASRQQKEAIAQINEAVGQISSVVQSNSATAEQSAASAQELSAQATLLETVVSRFQLRS